MNLFFAIFLAVLAAGWTKECPVRKSNSKLFCYYSKLTDINSCECSHVILPANSDVKSIEKLRENLSGVKVLISVNEFNQGLVDILKTSKVDGLEINLQKLDSKNDITDFISTVRSKLGSDLYIVLSVPPKGETLAKYFDFKGLSKNADLFILQTAFLGANKNVTFHPSRLSGLWDMQNTDSVVDLVTGLGAPLSKLVVTVPVQAFHFTLQNEDYTAPGSPALEVKSISRDELCKLMKNGNNWTLERDQDQTGPYIFSKDQWIAFEDATSMDIKAKYSRVRGLAGIALKDLSQDGGSNCESTILEAAHTGLSRQARAPRGAVLHSLEREILETSARPLDSIQVSPYRISRVIDVEGHVHVVRQDTRTEFECSRQGYFVHPRSCNRFYRCVKFDQQSDEFSVFEFDCPAGLAFDEKVEVCVWPGSLPHGSACAGSSEIAPVPKNRFICPGEPGYYADPENCRWFFACLDHGKSPLTAYEFRCPFGLVFDQEHLVCEWPWIVPRCAVGEGYGLNLATQTVYGSSAAILDQYDGLGTLGAVKLGGLSGTINQPVKIYSNVGAARGFASGGYNINGLSSNAALSLANAGLLKSDLLATGQLLGTSANLDQSHGGLAYVQQSNAYDTNAGLALNSGLDASSGLALNSASVSGLNGEFNLKSGYSGQKQQTQVLLNDNQYYHDSSQNQVLGQYQANLASLENAAGYGAKSHQSFVQHNQNQGAILTGGISGENYQQGVAIDTNLGSLGGKSQQTFVRYNQNPDAILTGGISGKKYEGIAIDSNLGSLGGKSQQSFIQYKQNQGEILTGGISGENYQQGVALDSNLEGYLGGKSQQSFVQHNQNQEAILTGGVSGGSYRHNVVVDTLKSNLHGSLGAKSQQSFVQYNQNQGTTLSGDISGDHYQGGVIVDHVKSNLDGSLGGQASVEYFGNFGSRIQGNYDGNVESSLLINTGKYNGNTVGSLIDTQGSVQYTDSSKTGTLGNINIVGGGYSAVGVANSGVEVLNNGENNDIISHVTASPATVTTVSSVPIVSSVPLPAVKTVHAFESYKGGVVANVPELQYKIQSSTVAPVTLTRGYTYTRPSIAFKEQPLLIKEKVQPAVTLQSIKLEPKPFSVVEPVQGVSYNIQKTLHQNQGYVYNKPSVSFEERPLNTLNVPVTVTQPTVNLEAVSNVHFQKQENTGGYVYEKPSVLFEEKPKVNAFVTTYSQVSTPKPFTVIEQKPQVYVSSTAVPIVQQQPIVTYSTPKPFTVVSSTAVPIIQQKPSVSTYNYKQVAKSVGYSYPKPSIGFEERPIVSVQPTLATYQQVQPIVEQKIVQQPAISFSYKQNIQSGGYNYPKPTVAFEEKPVQIIQKVQPVQKIVESVQPVITSYNYQQPTVVKTESVGYNYPKPTVAFEEKPIVSVAKPAVVSTYHYQQPSVQQTVVKDVGYEYPKPQINFEERPIVPLVRKPVSKPAVVSTYHYQQPSVQQTIVQDVKSVGYDYPKPSVVFEEKPIVPVVQKTVSQPAVVSTYHYQQPSIQQTVVQDVKSVGYDYPKPSVVYEEKPIVQSVISQKPAIISSFHIQNTNTQKTVVQPVQPLVQQVETVGYEYPKPSIAFEEKIITQTPKPIVTSYKYEQPIIQQPIQPVVPLVKQEPAVFSTYSYQKPVSTYTYKDIVQKTVITPAVTTVRPAVVSSYSYVAPSTPKPQVVVQPIVRGYEYPKPSVTFVEEPTPVIKDYKEPAVVSTYNYVAPSTYKPDVIVNNQKPVEFKGYDYPKPSVQFVDQPIVTTYENREPVQEIPFVKKKAYVTGQSNSYQYKQKVETGYKYPKPAIKFEEQPVVVEDYAAPQIVSTTPAYEEAKQYSSAVDSSNFYFVDKAKDFRYVSSTPEYYPEVEQEVQYIQSTPKPTFSSTIAAIIKPKIQPVTYRPIIKTTLAPTYETVTSSRPIVRYSFSSLDDQYQQNYVSTEAPLVVSTVQVPQIRTRVKVTTPTYVEEYIAPELTSPAPEYLPGTIKSTILTPTREYIPVKTTVVTPTKEYLPVRTRVPSRDYLPVRSRVRVTTTTANYDDEEQEIQITSRRPVKVVKVVRPKAKAIIKQNDFHPLLAAKLGAQCTCVSNTVKLRRKKPQKIIVVEDDDDNDENDDDDDGYAVSSDSDNGPIVVENYQYDPEKIVDITPAPEVYIKSTTNAIVAPAPEYKIRKRVRVRPISTTEAYISDEPEIVVKSRGKAITIVEEDDKPSDREIVKAVKTGLKLVKQAAKEGAKEGTEEVISKSFDRYGPGGVRSRNERLQGTIDCQRAGLFRHPTQCNKFYSCRWDCKKNKFTLHVFNCPIHLTFDNNLGACNWPSQGPACLENTLLPSD